MAASRPNLKLEPNTWTNIYDAPDLNVGDKLVIANSGNTTVKFSESVAEPTTEGTDPILSGQYYSNNTANVGAWVFASGGGILHIEKSV